jgi:hypothetical protein
MKILTDQSILVCNHVLGKVGLQPSQQLVTIQQRSVLVEPDPEKRPITGCPNYGVAIKPCQNTLKVREGYSDLLRIQGQRVCLDTISGLTDGTPPGAVKYRVYSPEQDLVTEAG